MKRRVAYEATRSKDGSRSSVKRNIRGDHRSRRGNVPAFPIGTIRGSATGEMEGDPMAGGWEGTDDATSTAPSDLSGISASPTGRISDLAPPIDDFEDELPSEWDLRRLPTWRPSRWID